MLSFSPFLAFELFFLRKSDTFPLYLFFYELAGDFRVLVLIKRITVFEGFIASRADNAQVMSVKVFPYQSISSRSTIYAEYLLHPGNV